MVHNGVEYGMMQAYAEGFALMQASDYPIDNAKVAHLWQQGSVVRSWLCELAWRAFEQEGNELEAIEGWVDDSGEGRWTVEDAIERRVPMPVITALAVRPLRLAQPGRLRRPGQRRPARPVRRPRGEDEGMSTTAPTAVPENPLVEGLERLPVHPTTLTIFGATGDLAKRKLLPALYNLAHEGAMPERFHLIGVSRSEMTHEEFASMAAEAIRSFSRREPDERVLAGLLDHVRYVPGTFDVDSVFEALAGQLAEFDTLAGQPMNRAFYLSTAPDFFPVIVGQLGEHGLARHPRRRRARDHREAVRHDAGGGARAQRRTCSRSSRSARSSGSTTTWARKPSRT